jgi:hypothetical protein
MIKWSVDARPASRSVMCAPYLTGHQAAEGIRQIEKL